MTTYNKTTLKTFFETGDVPSGQNFADFIDSDVNLVETGTQSMAGALSTPELMTARVSATNGNFTGTMAIAGITSATTQYIDNALVSAARFSTGIVSALGTAQASGALLSYTINFGMGVVDGITTGFLLPANQKGRLQFLVNGGASANLWPCVGGQINALSSNAAFGMAANTLYTVVHTLASGYAVK